MQLSLPELAELRELTTTGEAMRLRIDSKIRRREMAEKVGVTYVRFQKWELGLRSPSGPAAFRYLRELRALATREAVSA